MTKTEPVINSLIKYLGEIGALQYLHLPINNNQEKIGILS